jgi:hypothetical protein
MKSSALIVIESDPRLSGRAAEALRIAAGVSVWKRVKVAVCFRDAAVQMLGPEAEGLVNGDSYREHLAILKESAGAIFVPKGTGLMDKSARDDGLYEEISDEQLAVLAASSSCVLRF